MKKTVYIFEKQTSLKLKSNVKDYDVLSCCKGVGESSIAFKYAKFVIELMCLFSKQRM